MKQIHRTLPHSVEAEQGVLGSMLLSPSAAAEARAAINNEYFYVPAHQTVFAELCNATDAGLPIDHLTFCQWLHDKRLLQMIGGRSFVIGLTTFVPTAANIAHYLETVREKYVLRQVIAFSTESVRRAYEEQDDVNALVEQLKLHWFKLGLDGMKAERTIRHIIDDVIHDLSEPEKLLGLSTGFPKLDEVIGGLAPSAKIVIAGMISGGKSAFVQGLAESLAVTRHIPTAIFTFEMSAQQTAQRIIQIRSEVPFRKIARQEAEMFEQQAFTKAAGEIAAAPLHIIADRLDIAGIRARCMQLKPRICIIDYLQIVPEKKQHGENRTDQLDRMSAETKQIAIDLNLTLIELSQLTEKDGKLVTRGSKGITADADMLLVLEGDDDEKKPIVSKQLTVAKQRDGARAQVAFDFHRTTTTFRERK